MGGGQTLNIGLPHLDKFAYIGVYSAGLAGGGGGRASRHGALRKAWEKEHQAVLDDTGLKKGLKLLWFGIGKERSRARECHQHREPAQEARLQPGLSRVKAAIWPIGGTSVASLRRSCFRGVLTWGRAFRPGRLERTPMRMSTRCAALLVICSVVVVFGQEETTFDGRPVRVYQRQTYAGPRSVGGAMCSC